MLKLEPAARALRVRATSLAAEYDSLRLQTGKLQRAFDDLRRLSAGRGLTAADRVALRRLRATVTAIAAQSGGVQASAALTDIPAAMRVALAEASGSESGAAGMLLEALADLALGDRTSAAAWIARAEVAWETLAARMGEAQRLGLVDLAERERVLGERASRMGQGVALWVLLGAAMVGLAMLVLQRRLYAPMARLDRGLARVAQGDLDASLPVGSDDELGRLAAHFNEMTSVLRSRPEVETLRRERFLVDTLMEHVPDSIYFKDAESRFLRVNRAMAQRVRLSDPAELVGSTDFDFFSRDHAEAARRDELQIIRTGRPLLNHEEQETWPDRPSTWVSTTKMPLRDSDGHVVGTFGISRDVTERREAERLTRESETRFRTAFMTMADGHYIATRDDGRLVEVNDRFMVIFGYPRDEVVGRTSLELGLYADPADRARMLEQLRSTGQVRDLELVARRKTGETLPILLSVSQIPSTDPPLILGVVRDVTEQRRTDAALRSMEEQFRQAQRLEAVGRLAGGVAHDFNNIVQAISGYTELLLSDVPAQRSQARRPRGDPGCGSARDVAHQAAPRLQPQAGPPAPGAQSQRGDPGVGEDAPAPDRRGRRARLHARLGPWLREGRPGADRAGAAEPRGERARRHARRRQAHDRDGERGPGRCRTRPAARASRPGRT